MLTQSPSQTAGPFFHDGLISGGENILVEERTSGQRIQLEGGVFDGDGEPILDALVEIWQADAQGYFNHPVDPNQLKADKFFRGFGRSDTVDGGRFCFKTVKPGPVAWKDEQAQAPHVNVRLFARGMLIHGVTRLYFSDESANQTDPVLSLIAPERRSTLIATLEPSEELPRYCFDIRLQGARETVFFNP